MMQTPKVLPPGQQLVAPGKWPLVGERESIPTDGVWTISITGLVQLSRQWTIQEIAHLPQTRRSVDIHCVTRWSKPNVEFGGVLLGDMLQICQPLPAAKFVSFVSRSARRHSSSLPLADALGLETMIATHVFGEPLTQEHGGPVRNVVPNRYFYKSVKWLTEIELLADDRLGFWEAEAGYHNVGDPFMEQRYMAPTIDRRTAARLLEQRDFRDQDLRSIDVSRRNLIGLNAHGALLRDANFRYCDLVDSDFSEANLSNAHFQKADLRKANFRNADLEGANFAGADLRHVEFENASLFGASFWEMAEGQRLEARIDSTTNFSLHKLEALTPDQYEFVIRAREMV